jgi:hypothetical protein
MAKHEEITDVFRVLVETPGRDRSLGKPRHRCEGHIEMDTEERGCGIDSSGSG